MSIADSSSNHNPLLPKPSALAIPANAVLPELCERPRTPDVATATRLIRTRFLNRTDRVAFKPSWGQQACPAVGDSELDTLIARHVSGGDHDVRWRTIRNKEGTDNSVRVRIGTYSPATDGNTIYGCVDFDGGGRHSNPLADPGAASLAFLDNCNRAGLAAHLERSGGGAGWHVWLLFSVPVPAASVRMLVFTLLPAVKLASGSDADPCANTGIEVFPKQDRIKPNGVGNMVWLPWWHGAVDGGCQFYRFNDTGEIEPYLPDDFETIDQEAFEAALRTLPTPERANQQQMPYRSPANHDKRRSADDILKWALGKASISNRNATGLQLACQLRDNGYGCNESESLMRAYVASVPRGEHPYTEGEALASLRSAFTRPPREPWPISQGGLQIAGNRQTDTIDLQRRWSANINGDGGNGSSRGDDPVRVPEAGDDPHRLARLFLATHRDADNRLLLRYWQDEPYRWSMGAYRKQTDGEVRAELVRVIKREFDRLAAAQAYLVAREPADDAGSKKKKKLITPRPVTRTLVGNVLQAIQSESLLLADILPPVWLDGGGPDPADLFACRNATVNLSALVDGKPDAIMAPTPRLFNLSAAQLDFDPHAPKPETWLRFLAELWADDVEARNTLAEIFGYLLTSDTKHQKIFLLVGPPRSGKGTIGRIIRRLLGDENVAGPTLSSLGTNFGLWPLIGRPCAIVSDARLGGRADMAVITERLLSISGEDGQTIDRKNLSLVTTRLPTRFVILTNELPRIADASGAVASRFIILRFTESFLGREDKDLESKLAAELSGILLWAIGGWQRLRERGYFVQPVSALADVQDLADLASPVRAFIRECCDLEPALSIRTADLYRRWQDWCGSSGKKEPGDKARFGKDLKAALPSIRRTQPREGDERTVCYDGIALKESIPAF